MATEQLRQPSDRIAVRVPEVATFTSPDGLTIAYYTWGEPGERPPVVLHHGFIADARSNWEAPGIVAALLAAGRYVVAPDARGHGASAAPHDPARYGEDKMARDVGALADLLGFTAFDLAGYSMGGIVALLVGAAEPRVRRLVAGGIGAGVVDHGGLDQQAVGSSPLAAALRADDPATITNPAVRAFRDFADATGGDRLAFAAQADAAHASPIAFTAIAAPTLVLAGEDDAIARDPARLAAAIPGAELRMVPGDHLGAVRRPELAAAIVEFLGR
jgi:pimeloyl-ACP methyl ester carboxylesterase